MTNEQEALDRILATLDGEDADLFAGNLFASDVPARIQARIDRLPEDVSPLPEVEAYRFGDQEGIERFEEEPDRSYDPRLMGFYAYLRDDGRLRTSFALRVDAAQIAGEHPELITPPPPDLMERIALAEAELSRQESTRTERTPVMTQLRKWLEALFPRPVLSVARADTGSGAKPRCLLYRRDSAGQTHLTTVTGEIERAEVDRRGRLRIELHLLTGADLQPGQTLALEVMPEVLASGVVRQGCVLLEAVLPADVLPTGLQGSPPGQWLALDDAVCRYFRFVLEPPAG